METLIGRWLKELEKLKVPHNLYDNTVDGWLENERKKFEENKDPIHLIYAFNDAVEFERSIPEWVIKGLNAEKRLQKYRPFPKDAKIEFLSNTEVMSRWAIDNRIKLARHIWNDNLGYYVISGKWLSEVARAMLEKKITTRKQNPVSLIANSWTWVDDGEISFDKILGNLDDLAFCTEDIIDFEKKHGLGLAQKPLDKDNRGQYYFILNGDFWDIGFEEEKGHLKKIDGLKYISQLISCPGREIHTRDLYEGIKCAVSSANRKIRNDFEEPGRLEQEGLNKGMSYQPSSHISKKQIERMNELKRDMEDSDPLIKQEAKTEFQKLVQKFQSNKSSQVSEIGAPRINVSKRIESAIRKIETSGLPKLSNHLKSHVKTGTQCVYYCDPETMPKWCIKQF